MSTSARRARRYALLLRGPVLPPVSEVAAAMAGHERAPLADVARRVRAARGILAEGLAKAAASAAAEHLAGRGLAALALPATLLEDLPPERPLARAALEKAGLRAPDARGPLPWRGLDVIAAGAIAQSVPRPDDVPSLGQQAARLGLSLLTGLPLSLRPRREPKKPAGKELFFFLEILWRDPPRRLSLDAQAFDYSCLGGRMGYGSAGNFKRLVAELSRRAPDALLSHGARALLEGRAPSEPGYESLADLEREARWLLSLRALKLA